MKQIYIATLAVLLVACAGCRSDEPVPITHLPVHYEVEDPTVHFLPPTNPN
jgi:hypothetical protein